MQLGLLCSITGGAEAITACDACTTIVYTATEDHVGVQGLLEACYRGQCIFGCLVNVQKLCRACQKGGHTKPAHLNAQKDDDVSVLKLVDHLGCPRIVEKVYVLKPASLACRSGHMLRTTQYSNQTPFLLLPCDTSKT